MMVCSGVCDSWCWYLGSQHQRGEREFPFLTIPGNTGLPFPFPKYGNEFFHSRSQKLGMQFSIHVPVSKIRECNFPFPFPYREWIIMSGIEWKWSSKVGNTSGLLTDIAMDALKGYIIEYKWKLGQQIPWLLWQKLFTLRWATRTRKVISTGGAIEVAWFC